MSRIDNVRAKDKGLIARIEETCRLAGRLVQNHDCYSFNELLVYIAPAYYFTRYTMRGKEVSLVESEFVQLAAPPFPALPVYVVRWGLLPKDAVLPSGPVVLRSDKGQSTMIACKPSMRLLTPPGVRIGHHYRRGLWPGLVHLSLLTAPPILDCNSVAGNPLSRLAGFMHIGHRGVGVISLTPYVRLEDRLVLLDTWKGQAYTLEARRIEPSAGDAGAAPACNRGVIAGLGWIITMLPEERYVHEPVVCAEYRSESSLAAFLVMLSFALILRRDSLSFIASLVRRHAGNSFGKFLDELGVVIRRESQKRPESMFLDRALRDIELLSVNPVVNLDSVTSLANDLARKMGVEHDIDLSDPLVAMSVREASEELGCRPSGLGVEYECPNIYASMLLQAAKLMDTSVAEGGPLHASKLVELIEAGLRLAKFLYGDVFPILASLHK